MLDFALEYAHKNTRAVEYIDQILALPLGNEDSELHLTEIRRVLTDA